MKRAACRGDKKLSESLPWQRMRGGGASQSLNHSVRHRSRTEANTKLSDKTSSFTLSQGSNPHASGASTENDDEDIQSRSTLTIFTEVSREDLESEPLSPSTANDTTPRHSFADNKCHNKANYSFLEPITASRHFCDSDSGTFSPMGGLADLAPSLQVPRPYMDYALDDIATPVQGTKTPCALPSSFTGNTMHQLSYSQPLCQGSRLLAAPVVPIQDSWNEAEARKEMLKKIELLSASNNDASFAAREEKTSAAALAKEEGGGDSKPPNPKESQAKTATRDAPKGGKKPAKSHGAALSQPKKIPVTEARKKIIHLGAVRLIQRLHELHLTTQYVKNDGNCQFRAIAQQLLGSEKYHDVIRSHVVSYMKRVRATKFDHYFESTKSADTYFYKLSQNGFWGDELTLRAASDSLFINIHIISSEERNFYIVYKPNEDAPPAPTFLLDVAKVRARCEAERLYHQHYSCQRTLLSQGGTKSSTWSGVAKPSCHSITLSRAFSPTSSFSKIGLSHFSQQQGQEAGGGLFDKPINLPDDGITEVDASAIQQVLQKRLSKTHITSNSAFLLAMGERPQQGVPTALDASDDLDDAESSVFAAKDYHADSSGSWGSPGCVQQAQTLTTNTHVDPTHGFHIQKPPEYVCAKTCVESAKGGHRAPESVWRPEQQQQHARQAELPLPLDARMIRTSKVHAGLAKLMATGAVLDTLNNSVTVLSHPMAADATQSMRLLHPVREKQEDESEEESLTQRMAATTHTHPLFHMNTEDGIMLLAMNKNQEADSNSSIYSGTNRFESPQSNWFTSPCNNSSPMRKSSGLCWNSSTANSLQGSMSRNGSMNGLNLHPEEIHFVFEPRTRPIDVFLSYLYPVHYNALRVCNPRTSDSKMETSDQNTDGVMLPEMKGVGDKAEGSMVSVPFLRPQVL